MFLLLAFGILNFTKVQCQLEAGNLEDATTRGRAPACKATHDHVLSLDHMYLYLPKVATWHKVPIEKKKQEYVKTSVSSYLQEYLLYLDYSNRFNNYMILTFRAIWQVSARRW